MTENEDELIQNKHETVVRLLRNSMDLPQLSDLKSETVKTKGRHARDVMSMRQLNLIEMADEVIAQSLKESMEKKLPYKECYQEAKARIEQLAKILPKSPLPALLGKIKP